MSGRSRMGEEEKEGKRLLLPASRCSLSLSRLSCTTVELDRGIKLKDNE